MTIVTNIGRPLADPARKGRGKAKLTYMLVDGSGKRVERFGLDGTGPVYLGEVTVGLDANGEHSVELVPNEGLEDSHYAVQLQDGRSRRQWTIQVPDSAAPVDFWDLVAAGRPLTAAEYSALQVHLADDERHLETDERAALSAANAPNGANPIATLADVTGGGLPTGEADQDVIAGQPLRLLATGHLDLASATTPGYGEVAGLCGADTVAGNGAPYTRGQITRADWTGIAGTAALSPGAVYYLDPGATGSIVSLAPDQTGHYLIRVGVAANPTTLQAAIEPPIRL